MSADEPIDPYRSPEALFHTWVLAASKDLERAISRFVAPAGVTSAQFYILLSLNGNPGKAAQPRQIGATLLSRRLNLTDILDRMDRAELVRQEANPADRRSVLVRVTEHGEAVLGRALAEYTRGIRALLDGFDRSAVDDARSLLARLLARPVPMKDSPIGPLYKNPLDDEDAYVC